MKHAFPRLSQQNKEWDFLLDNKLNHSLSTGKSTTSPSWIPSGRETAFHELQSQLPELVGICKEFKDVEVWREWVQSPTPELSLLLKIRINPLQKLTLIAALCPRRYFYFTNILIFTDCYFNLFFCRLQEAIERFVHEMLGPVPCYNIDSMAEYFHCDFPVLFIIAPGTDPSQELGSYARTKRDNSNFIETALGAADQSQEAIEKIKTCASEGKWILVKNVHLASSFIRQLSTEFTSWNKDSNFQLFMTTESALGIPATLLESCTKANSFNSLVFTFSPR